VKIGEATTVKKREKEQLQALDQIQRFALVKTLQDP
jgi:hypothetical protein